MPESIMSIVRDVMIEIDPLDAQGVPDVYNLPVAMIAMYISESQGSKALSANTILVKGILGPDRISDKQAQNLADRINDALRGADYL